MVRKDPQVPLDSLVQQDELDHQAPMVTLVPQAHQVLLGKMVPRVPVVTQGQLDVLVILVCKALLVLQARRENLEKMALLVQTAHLDLRVWQDREV